MSERPRLLSEADTGISDDIFVPGFKGDISTTHGNQLRCRVAKSYVSIEDPKPIPGAKEYAHFGIEASVITNPLVAYDADLFPVIRFFILTRHNAAQPQLHPDLRARALGGRIIQYFDSIADVPVRTLHADWFTDEEVRTEYDRYHAALGKPHEEATPEERHEATRSTLAHTLAMDQGFTDIREIEKRGEGPDTYVSVYFVRPQKA